MAIQEQPPVLSVEGQGPPVGTLIRSFLLTDESSPGMACQIISLGATLTHLWVPDNQGHSRDIVLGFDDLTAYRTKHDPYFGASVGRTANRIAKGAFSLPDNPSVVYKLAQNNGPNSLHGGIDGFSFRNWDVLPIDHVSSRESGQGTALHLSMVSDHMDQGFPARLRVYCTYRLINMSLKIEYEAHLENSSEQQVTIASLTNHAYFNLNGVPASHLSGTTATTLVTNHVLEMSNIDSYLETDDTSVPTGNVVPLDQAPVMDFRRPKAIGQSLTHTPGGGHGYDHFYSSQAAARGEHRVHLCNDVCVAPVTMVQVYSPDSGILMKMATTEPGFQLYTANFVQLDANQVDVKLSLRNSRDTGFPQVGKARGGYLPHSALCLEASKFPDAINHPAWRDQVILRSTEKYLSTIVFTFSVK
ncbi:hypothetical protein EDD11_002898 [Mortierella claussenii]|nr:hypothetical protein EDD11_002898 [Mortierella claussenii]